MLQRGQQLRWPCQTRALFIRTLRRYANHFTFAVENRRTFVISVDGNTYQERPSVLDGRGAGDFAGNYLICIAEHEYAVVRCDSFALTEGYGRNLQVRIHQNVRKKIVSQRQDPDDARLCSAHGNARTRAANFAIGSDQILAHKKSTRLGDTLI